MLLTARKMLHCPNLSEETVLRIQILQRMNYAMGFAIKIYKISINTDKEYRLQVYDSSITSAICESRTMLNISNSISTHKE